MVLCISLIYYLRISLKNKNQQEHVVESEEFSKARGLLGKTQKELAELLGVSIKAVHSYEQGWRNIPSHVERQVFFLISRTRASGKVFKPCWIIKKCPPQRRKLCPAWEFQAGKLCWFINGTLCGECKDQTKRVEKIKICRSCKVLAEILSELL